MSAFFCHFVQDGSTAILQTDEVAAGVLTLLKRYTILQAGKSIQLSKDSQDKNARTEQTQKGQNPYG